MGSFVKNKLEESGMGKTAVLKDQNSDIAG